MYFSQADCSSTGSWLQKGELQDALRCTEVNSFTWRKPSETICTGGLTHCSTGILCDTCGQNMVLYLTFISQSLRTKCYKWMKMAQDRKPSFGVVLSSTKLLTLWPDYTFPPVIWNPSARKSFEDDSDYALLHSLHLQWLYWLVTSMPNDYSWSTFLNSNKPSLMWDLNQL